MEKPRFYYMDLKNYTSEFLEEIILWQKERIAQLEETNYNLLKQQLNKVETK